MPQALELAPLGEAPQRVGLDLPHALARDPHDPPDLLERLRLGIAVEAVAELDDRLLARGQVGDGAPERLLGELDLDFLLRPQLVRGEQVAEGSSRFTIGDVVELQMQTMKNPVTGAEIHPRLALPEGLLVRDLGLYASKTFRVCDGIDYDHSGRYAALGAFDYAGP